MEGTPSLREQARAVLAELEVPDPPSELEYHGVRVHEVLGPRNECLLMAFGLVPLPRMLEVANAYHSEVMKDDPEPWDAEDSDKVVDALNRLHYERLAVTVHPETPADGPAFTVHWEVKGIMPMTTWLVKQSPRDV